MPSAFETVHLSHADGAFIVVSNEFEGVSSAC